MSDKCKRCNDTKLIPVRNDPHDFGGNEPCPDCNPRSPDYCWPLFRALDESDTNIEPAPTINNLVALVTEINTANGWRERDMSPITPETPAAQVAGLTPIYMESAAIIERIRKPGNRTLLGAIINNLRALVLNLWTDGLAATAQRVVGGMAVAEIGAPLYGSKTMDLCRLRLIDTETAEASEALLQGDAPHLAKELADIGIRLFDFVGAWNEAHPDQPIDLEKAIAEVLKANRERGWKHGGRAV